jgi:hypothetical protein
MDCDDCSQEISRVLTLLTRANLVILLHQDGRYCLAADAASAAGPVPIDIPTTPSSPVIDAMIDEGLLAVTTVHEHVTLTLTAEGRRRSRPCPADLDRLGPPTQPHRHHSHV